MVYLGEVGPRPGRASSHGALGPEGRCWTYPPPGSCAGATRNRVAWGLVWGRAQVCPCISLGSFRVWARRGGLPSRGQYDWRPERVLGWCEVPGIVDAGYVTQVIESGLFRAGRRFYWR